MKTASSLYCLPCNGLLDWISVLDMKGDSPGALELLGVAAIAALHEIME